MDFSIWPSSVISRFSSACLLVVFCLGCSTAPKSANVESQAVEECQVSDAAYDAIEAALSEAKKNVTRIEVYRLIDEAQAAAEPPECDGVRATILADKAKRLIELGDDEVVIAEKKYQKVDTPREENGSRKHTGNRPCGKNCQSISEFTDNLFKNPIIFLLAWSALGFI